MTIVMERVQLAVVQQPIKLCAICQGTHYHYKTGFQDGMFHKINNQTIWIGSSCFGDYTCMIAEGILSFQKVPTRDELYRAYHRYCKTHHEGEPWWDFGIVCDTYEKKRYLLDTQIRAFMECVF